MEVNDLTWCIFWI